MPRCHNWTFLRFWNKAVLVWVGNPERQLGSLLLLEPLSWGHPAAQVCLGPSCGLSIDNGTAYQTFAFSFWK